MSNTKDQFRMLERHEFVAQCRLRAAGCLARISIVRNLTSEGCAVECIPVTLQRGDTIYLQFGNVGPVEGRVIWLRKGVEAGVQFEQGLHPAVFDRLLHIAHRNMILSDDPQEMLDDLPAYRKTGPRVAAC
ncbi:hypothetical protein [Croceicoccus sp. Ery15]|uniref:hypothetical protein n=1 Tax=Croceicoccus sp. Ery15 TaxID=1703338 RepID=UPI001E3CA41D|nr:hypothetical protein [Croceicoccus sp. Ery15]